MDGQKKKILLVEDDDTLAEVYRQRLELEGFDVRRSNNGESALSDAVEYHPALTYWISCVIVRRVVMSTSSC